MRTKFDNIGIVIYDKNSGEELLDSDGVVVIQDDKLTEGELKKKKYRDTHIQNAFKGERFVKIFDKAVKPMMDLLSPMELKVAFGLITLVSYEDCIIRKNGHGNGRILNTREISEDLGMEYNTVRKVLPTLKKYGIIGLHETGSISADLDNCKTSKVYTVNPFIYCRGVHFNKTIYDFYANTGWNFN